MQYPGIAGNRIPGSSKPGGGIYNPIHLLQIDYRSYSGYGFYLDTELLSLKVTLRKIIIRSFNASY